MSYSVVVSEQVKTLLEELHRNEIKRSRELALLLLRLEKDARPEGSRRLSGSKRAQSAGEDRVWAVIGFRIAYRVIDAGRLVEVGIVTRD